MIWKTSLLAALFQFAALSCDACERHVFEDVPITICEADARRDDIRVFHKGPDGKPLATFGAVETTLAQEGKALIFAMNAGMYHADRSPVGLYVEDGQQHAALVTRAGPGNFGMLPNGVFCIREGRADVIEARTFAKRTPPCRHATQSGPMLVIDGKLHPRFLPRSTSRYIRNGVGTSADGARVVFAISEIPVTFHRFARFFRDVLDVPNALFLDGNISRLYDSTNNRSDFGRPMGPIVGVVAPKTP